MKTIRPACSLLFNSPLAVLATLWVGSVVDNTVHAQSPESDYIPLPGEFEPAAPPEPNQPYLMPDVPASVSEQTHIESRWFTLKPGLVLLGDYTAFSQDANSVSQVGRQENKTEFRAFRLMVRGTIGREYKVRYLVAGEYNGFDTDPDKRWELTDLAFTFPLAGPSTQLTLGKTKETFAYEMVGDAANLPHPERILSPFFVSRNVGAKVTQVIGDQQRMTASAGIYNDWWAQGDSLNDSGTDVTARFTGLVWDQSGGKSFLHLGVSGRYAGADNNSLRYKGRPQSNVADTYVDTGNLTADHAWHLGLEALWNEGPVSLLAEYNRAWVESPAVGNPELSGWYLTASWVLTGETRPYDRTVGYARRVMPLHRWGAPELVARISHVDLDDGPVQGGKMDNAYLGINWWVTRRWKVGAGWTHTWLDRLNMKGNTDSFLTRLQWIY